MTTLVTGAFGCIGAWAIRGLLAAGERPVVFDLGDDPWRVRMIAPPDAPQRLTVVRGDITDRAQLERVVRDHGIRRIIHLAAWQVPLCRQDPPRGASINVTLLSYVDTCCIGVSCDTAAVPDPEVLVDCLREGFEEVLALGGEHRPTRLPFLEDPS